MSIEDDVGLLERVPTFSVLSREALRVLAIGAESRTLEEGEILFHAGETADCGYVVEEGALTALPPRRSGTAVTLTRGALLGEMSLLTETRRPTTVMAAEPSSVMRIGRPLFLKMLQGYPELAERLRQAMMQRAETLAAELGNVRRALDVGDDAAEPGSAEPR
jgi:CRP-like cAMP-binding protein